MKNLKYIFCFCLFLGFSEAARAQQISYRKEQILVNGQPYGYLFKNGSSWAKNFSFQNNHNVELAQAKAISKDVNDGFDYVYYEVSFKGYSQKAEMEDNAEFAQRLAREFAGLNILKDDNLDPAAVQKFLEKYPPVISRRLNEIPPKAPVNAPLTPAKEKAPETETTTGNANRKDDQVSVTEPVNTAKPALKSEPTAVAITAPPAGKSDLKPEQNAGAPVAVSSAAAMNKASQNGMVPGLKISGATILKNNQKIGRFAVNERAISDKLRKTYTFYNVRNQKIAEANFAGPESSECSLTTTKDKKSRSVKIANNGEALKALASWLVRNRYF